MLYKVLGGVLISGGEHSGCFFGGWGSVIDKAGIGASGERGWRCGVR